MDQRIKQRKQLVIEYTYPRCLTRFRPKKVARAHASWEWPDGKLYSWDQPWYIMLCIPKSAQIEWLDKQRYSTHTSKTQTPARVTFIPKFGSDQPGRGTRKHHFKIPLTRTEAGMSHTPYTHWCLSISQYKAAKYAVRPFGATISPTWKTQTSNWQLAYMHADHLENMRVKNFVV